MNEVPHTSAVYKAHTLDRGDELLFVVVVVFLNFSLKIKLVSFLQKHAGNNTKAKALVT